MNMVVMKMTHMKHVPKYCDDCIYYSCKPHPYKGWTNSCELCVQCLDDDQEEEWIYDGNERPKNCPLIEVDDLQAESEEDGITFNNLCNSCSNIGCEFQSGIVRTKCTFYMPPHIEPDNCGNYIVMHQQS